MRKKITTVMIVFLGMVIAFCAFMIAKDKIQRSREISEFEDIASIVNSTTAVDTTGEVAGDNGDYNGSDTEKIPVFKRNLKPIFEKNNDCIGWISIEGTTVDYPVMYTPSEHQKYLRKNFEGKYSISGVPFMQENCTLESDNIIIYGHNMENGTMFSDVTAYIDEAYSKKHPTIEFETALGLETYTVFAVAQVKSTDSWYSFVGASDSDSFDEKIAEICKKALYVTDVTPEYGQKLLTLSTCYGKYDNDRMIVICVKN